MEVFCAPRIWANRMEQWWNNGGTMVEQWWNNGGTVVEQWWNKVVEQWWNNGSVREKTGGGRDNTSL